MNIKTVLFSLLILNNGNSFGQAGLITFRTQTNPDKTVGIYANSNAYVSYTAKISFTSLNGFTSRDLRSPDIAIVQVDRGNSEVVKLTRENSNMPPSIQYKYQYLPGLAFRKMPDTGFQYLIPAIAGRQLRVKAISSTVSPISKQLKSEYRGTGFSFKLSDTICAARAGIVFECIDSVMEGEKMETAFRRGRNRILVEHRDGTIGNYGIIAPIKLLVAPGDEVFPGQPLAVFNKESEKYGLYFSIYYLDEKRLLAEYDPDISIYYIFMPTFFYANENESSTQLQVNKEYSVQHPKNIIAAEMSKKEKKKFGF